MLPSLEYITTSLLFPLLFLMACTGGQFDTPPSVDYPPPSGLYVDHPLSSHSYNLADYEQITGSAIRKFHEAPMLRERVEAGTLPPVEARLPDNPLVMIPWEEIGRYGEALRYVEFTIDYDHYLRHLNEVHLLEQRPEQGVAIYKWAAATVQPGVFESWERSPDATVFTFRIRKGLRWSDGVSVTTEDARFAIEDVILNPAITPVLPEWAKWGGAPIRIEVLDRYGFRLTFAQSYGLLLPRMTSWRWSTLLRPSHYLKQFHKRYIPIERLMPAMEQAGYASEDDWGKFYGSLEAGVGGAGGFVPTRMPRVGEYPTLDPWIHVRQPNPGDFILERNPYYYKIDPEGNQLPYIDRLSRTFVSDLQVENLKVVAGETHLQFQFLQLNDFPLFKRNEASGGYRVIPLPAWQDYMLIYPLNLNTADTILRPIIQDVRFRRALSLALNREEIKEALFLGFGRPAQLAPLPGSPWYDAAFEASYAAYDVGQAQQLLDEMGLPWDEHHEFRLRSDGKPLSLRIDFYNVTPPAAPGAELAAEYWRELGIQVAVQQVDGARFWQLRGINENQVTVWWANGATPVDNTFIAGFTMTMPWQQWIDTDGTGGVEPPEWVKEVYAYRMTHYATSDDAERAAAGKAIFRLFAEYLPAIGTVADTPVPFVFSKRLGNIAVAEQRGQYAITVAEAAEQWYFKRMQDEGGISP